jgi:hypothetical protein
MWQKNTILGIVAPKEALQGIQILGLKIVLIYFRIHHLS